MTERDWLLNRVCPFVTVWLPCIGSSKKGEIEQRFLWAVCVSVPMYDCDWGVHCSQRLMTFACCRYEQSDLAVLIKTNGMDHSLLIVFHWQMAHLSPEDCCRGLACLEHTDFTNENRWSVSVPLCVWVYVYEWTRVCVYVHFFIVYLC